MTDGPRVTDGKSCHRIEHALCIADCPVRLAAAGPLVGEITTEAEGEGMGALCTFAARSSINSYAIDNRANLLSGNQEIHVEIVILVAGQILMIAEPQSIAHTIDAEELIHIPHAVSSPLIEEIKAGTLSHSRQSVVDDSAALIASGIEAADGQDIALPGKVGCVHHQSTLIAAGVLISAVAEADCSPNILSLGNYGHHQTISTGGRNRRFLLTARRLVHTGRRSSGSHIHRWLCRLSYRRLAMRRTTLRRLTRLHHTSLNRHHIDNAHGIGKVTNQQAALLHIGELYGLSGLYLAQLPANGVLAYP